MANSIIMPKTGMAMEEGIILEWRVKEGDSVSKGDIVALIETDKSTMELESDYDGVILAILNKEGETVPVTKVIAWVGQSGEAVPAADAQEKPAITKTELPQAAASSLPASALSSEAVPSSETVPKISSENPRPKATPAARALAKERGIDLQTLVPDGKYGEIKRTTVEKAMAQTSVAVPSNIVGLASVGDTRVALTNIQKITGRRMLESRQTIPEVTANIRADITAMLELRTQLNNSMAASGMPDKITINDFIMFATAKTLLAHRRLNSVLDGAELIYRGSINLGMATATSRGLMVPVIHNAQDYSLAGLSSRAAELAAKAREGTLKNEEMSGGTFTISNVGMYGITAFTPIINPPEAAILGVCAVEDELALIGDKVTNRKKIGLSLAYDHRIVDGAESSIFLKALKDNLEASLLILV